MRLWWVQTTASTSCMQGVLERTLLQHTLSKSVSLPYLLMLNLGSYWKPSVVIGRYIGRPVDEFVRTDCSMTILHPTRPLIQTGAPTSFVDRPPSGTYTTVIAPTCKREMTICNIVGLAECHRFHFTRHECRLNIPFTSTCIPLPIWLECLIHI